MLILPMFPDFSKAFDCVTHEYILDEFRSFGSKLWIVQYSKYYLSNRTHRVKMWKTIHTNLTTSGRGIGEGKGGERRRSALGPANVKNIEIYRRQIKITYRGP